MSAACRLLASLAVMLVLQSQWSLQPQLDSKLAFGSSQSSTRHLLGAEALAVTAQHRPDWVRYRLLACLSHCEPVLGITYVCSTYTLVAY